MNRELETSDPTKDVPQKPKPDLFCTFCGKSRHEVDKLIAGPVCYICDECVDLCRSILYKPPETPSIAMDFDLLHAFPESFRFSGAVTILKRDSLDTKISERYVNFYNLTAAELTVFVSNHSVGFNTHATKINLCDIHPETTR